MLLPLLVIAEQDRSFYVACEACDFAIDCGLMQYYTDGAERVVDISRVR